MNLPKVVAVLGMGVSGLAVAETLTKRDVKFVFSD